MASRKRNRDDEVFNTHFRQKLIFDPDAYQDTTVLIVGCGGIGSHTAFCLAKMGIKNLTLIDMDEVAEENLGSQFFTKEQLGRPKVDALKENIENHMSTEVKIKVINKRADKSLDEKADIVILALDSLSAREEIFYSKTVGNAKFFVDGRMGAMAAMIYMFDMKDKEKCLAPYIESFKKEADPLPCAGKAIVFTLYSIAGIIASGVRSFIIERGFIPFQQYYDMENMVHTQVQLQENEPVQQNAPELKEEKPRARKSVKRSISKR